MESAIRPIDWRGLDELRPFLERRLARHCRDRSELDDVVQETLLRAARYREGLGERDSLRAWSLQIARNVLVDLARTRERQQSVLREAHQAGEVPDADREHPGSWVSVGGLWAEEVDVRDALPGALDELADTDRRLIATRYWSGRQGRDAAEACGVAPAVYKVRLHRARRRLVRALRRRLALDGLAGAVGASA